MAATTITSTTTPVVKGTTSNGISSSTTVAKNSGVSSSTTMTNSTTAISNNANGSTTPIIKNNKEAFSEKVEFKKYIFDGVGNILPSESIFDMAAQEASNEFEENLKTILDNTITFGVSYELGSVTYPIGIGKITYSASVNFSDNDSDAVLEISRTMDANMNSLEDFIWENGMLNADKLIKTFEGVRLRIDENGDMHEVVSKDGVEIDLNLDAYNRGKLDITFSMDEEIDNYVSITNSINVKMQLNINNTERVKSEVRVFNSEASILDEIGYIFMESDDVGDIVDNAQKEVKGELVNEYARADQIAEEAAEFWEVGETAKLIMTGTVLAASLYVSKYKSGYNTLIELGRFIMS